MLEGVLPGRAALCRAALLLTTILAALAPSTAAAATARPAIVGGDPIPITAVPWQVYVGIGDEEMCGGAVLGPTRVLTAAHCATLTGTTTPQQASDLTVLAGFTDVRNRDSAPPGTQTVHVASLRVHPGYDPRTKGDDVAVLTLKSPLDLSTPRTRAIAMAPPGGGPASGTTVAFSGYGAQVEGRLPDGRLYGAHFTAISDDGCRTNITANTTASVLCVSAPGQAPCFGDSGGPLTVNGRLVGVASYAPVGGCGKGPSGFADVTAPEVRAFIDGAAIPYAPRQSTPVVITAVNPPVEGSPMTCAPGTWSGVLSYSYTFVDDRTGRSVQSGSSRVLVPGRALIGAPIACVVRAGNGGGVSTARSGTAPAILADTIPPRAMLRHVRCRHRRCTVKFSAADSNSQGRLHIRVTVERRNHRRYRRCRRRHRRHHGHHRHRCHRVQRTRLELHRPHGVKYRATSRHRLHRGHARVRVRVVDAAGNRMRPSLERRVRVR